VVRQCPSNCRVIRYKKCKPFHKDVGFTNLGAGAFLDLDTMDLLQDPVDLGLDPMDLGLDDAIKLGQ
jgi:hypothetical protein